MQWSLSCCLTNTRVVDHDIGTSLLHHGVLHEMECNLIKKKDVSVKEEHVDKIFDHPTKGRFKGIMRKVPG